MMTETIETTADNSVEIETQEPEIAPTDVDNAETDNSDTEVNDKEPAETDGQFKDLAEANKAYAELRKLNGEQSTELGELRKLAEKVKEQEAQAEAEALQNAQNNGFNSVIEYENHAELVNFIADEYEKNLAECSYPDEVHNLLEQYRKTPDDTLLKTIENEFEIDTVKNITLSKQAKQGELQQRIYDAVKNSASEYLNENVNKYADHFKNPAFAELYGEAFSAFGVNLDTDKFVNLMDSFADYVLKSAGINNGIKNDNISATDEIAGLSSMGGHTQNSASEKSVLDMSEAEMNKVINKYL